MSEAQRHEARHNPQVPFGATICEAPTVLLAPPALLTTGPVGGVRMAATILDQPEPGVCRVAQMRILGEGDVKVILSAGYRHLGDRMWLRHCGFQRRWYIGQEDPSSTVRYISDDAARLIVGDAYHAAVHALLSGASTVRDDRREQILRIQREAERKILEERDSARRLFESAAEDARAQYAIGRHVQLSRWRQENPAASGAKAPECLRGVRHVKRLASDAPAIVYFLLRDGAVVYVGQTLASWPKRIEQHLNGGKVFDDVWYLEVDAVSVSQVEAAFIRQFSPEYNVSLKPKRRAL